MADWLAKCVMDSLCRLSSIAGFLFPLMDPYEGGEALGAKAFGQLRLGVAVQLGNDDAWMKLLESGRGGSVLRLERLQGDGGQLVSR